MRLALVDEVSWEPLLKSSMFCHTSCYGCVTYYRPARYVVRWCNWVANVCILLLVRDIKMTVRMAHADLHSVRVHLLLERSASFRIVRF